ncbi:MAG: transporter, partial [Rhizobacter sp.]|nr:transporter [Rhizobacter sp.]
MLLALPIACVALGACSVGPDYIRPTMDVPVAYKEAGSGAAKGWTTALPQTVATGMPWWQSYGDTVLSGLLADADTANFSLRVAEANYRQAQALADQARSSFFPTVGATAGLARGRNITSGTAREATVDTIGLSGSWIPDLWGGVRRAYEAGTDTAQASGDDLAAAHLSIESALAQNYFQLRITDRLHDLYADTIAAYSRSLQLVQSQFRAGVALRSDVALAESQLATAQAASTDLDATRATLEHAIAILTGKAPAAFSLTRLPADNVAAAAGPSVGSGSSNPSALPLPIGGNLADANTRSSPSASADIRVTIPNLPVGLPSELLQRRPDIAAAERRAAAANANIGVARAAYYPQITLSAAGGGSAAVLGNLFDTPSRVWSLGAALAQTVFDGGLRKARDAQAVAAYDASVASYKQTVLTAFGQVEDNLATLRVLEQEVAFQDTAVRSAQTAERLALAQYRGGTATYLNVVTAQTLLLTNQRTNVQLRGRQLAASVSLVIATGGGWDDRMPVADSTPSTPSTPS